MFNGQMSKYKVFSPISSLDKYGEQIDSFEYVKTIDMHVSLLNHNQYNGNDFRLVSATHIGLTHDRTIDKGMKIGNYLVEFVNTTSSSMTIVYLKEC